MDKWIIIAPCVLAGVLVLCITAIKLRKMGVKNIDAKLGKDGAEFKIGDGGERIIPKTALADEEIDRIAGRIGGHGCKDAEYHVQSAKLLEAVGIGVNALIQDAVAHGHNGPITEVAPYVKVYVTEFCDYMHPREKTEKVK